jgi:hypothetical protein
VPPGYIACVPDSSPTDLDRSLDPALAQALEERMRAMLSRTRTGKTICPSDVARSMADDWRPLMDPTRAAARRLVDTGEAEITQGGLVVDPGSAKGPIRIRPVR